MKQREKAGEIIRKTLSNIIRPRYDNEANDTNRDILASLLKAVDKDINKCFSFEEILDQVATLFLAGHETTASSLTWMLYCLALDQDVQQKAYDEIISINKNDKFTPQNIKDMKYLTNCFKEGLRLYPPVGYFARQNKKDIKIRDKFVKNALV